VSLADHERIGGYRHEAALYASDSEFLAVTRPFILDGLEAGEPTLVVVSQAKIEALRLCLGDAASNVQFADMHVVGANPARIIPAWREFLDRHGANGRQAVRGIGEPIDTSRRPAEVVESQIHESLLNLAFADDPDFALLCPYDTAGPDAATIAEAQRSHPHVRDAMSSNGSQRYEHPHHPLAHHRALPPPPVGTDTVAFDGGLAAIRQVVSDQCSALGTDPVRSDDFVLAVNEIATNSLRHGGGHGSYTLWHDDDVLYCEIRDAGEITNPLVGRSCPPPQQTGGRGLWIANQACDLVQVRTGPSGTVVRLHLKR
jgi:anti-sigma regulatory factor (Ser/Thr protein kinase)